MSIYINFEDDRNKYDWIREHGVMRHMGTDKSHLDFEDIKRYGDGNEDLVLVVWGKPSFEVLIVIHSESELKYFDLDDGIEKFWAYVPNKIVMEASPEYKKLYYANNVDILNNNVLEFDKSYYVRHNYSHPYIDVNGTKYKIDLDFVELGLDLDGDTIKISNSTLNYCTSTNQDMGIRIYVMEELRFDMTIDVDYCMGKVGKEWLASNTNDVVFGINTDTKFEDVMNVHNLGNNVVLVLWTETKLLPLLVVVYDEIEFKRYVKNMHDDFECIWGYVSKEVVKESCSEYKRMLLKENISNGIIKKEVLRNLVRAYTKQTGNKFNSEKIKFETPNHMLEAFYKEVHWHAEVGTHTGDGIIICRKIAAEALVYLQILGIRN